MIFAANGTASLMFIDDVTADRSSRMNFKVYRALDSPKCCKTEWTDLHNANVLMTQSILPK